MLNKKNYKSNKSYYFQFSFNKKVIITLKRKKKTNKQIKKLNEKLISYYASKDLRFSNFSFFFEEYFKDQKTLKKQITQYATEYAIESGFLK